ncbi:MAG: hypothetical protein ACRDXE_08055 [Acidimicrobiales bacterium]
MRNWVIGGAAGLLAAMVLIPTALEAVSHPSDAKAVAGVGTASTPPGYKPFVDRTDHFSIAVPAAWRSANPSSPGVTASVHDMLQLSPRLQANLGSGFVNALSRSTKFLAVDPTGGTIATSAVAVVVSPAIGATDNDLPQAEAGLERAYQQTAGTVVSSVGIDLAGHQALQDTVRVPTASGTTILETEDVLLANDFVYFITFAGSSPDMPTVASTFSVR